MHNTYIYCLYIISTYICRVWLQCRRPGFDPWVREIPPEEEMTNSSSIPAWRVGWAEEPGVGGAVQGVGVGHN